MMINWHHYIFLKAFFMTSESLFRISYNVFIIDRYWLHFLDFVLVSNRYHWSHLIHLWNMHVGLLYAILGDWDRFITFSGALGVCKNLNFGMSTFVENNGLDFFMGFHVIEVWANQSSLIIFKFIWQMSVEVVVFSYPFSFVYLN